VNNDRWRVKQHKGRVASSEHVLACFSALLQISGRHHSSLQPPVTPASPRCASYYSAHTTADRANLDRASKAIREDRPLPHRATAKAARALIRIRPARRPRTRSRRTPQSRQEEARGARGERGQGEEADWGWTCDTAYWIQPHTGPVEEWDGSFLRCE
jgi:hypothetical protein